ncbi:tetratricopeptide repeat protein [Kitasatospora purpeofusca]|uniref:tetratricopeptide repeat protein n=1 Tax=Kitasatospora purpeofusca TaxID=67352 RepID=UPI0035DE3B45
MDDRPAGQGRGGGRGAPGGAADPAGVVRGRAPRHLATRERLGWVLGLQGRLVEAEEELAAVVAERTRLLGPDYSGTLSSSVLLARVVAQRGRQEEAAALLADLHRRQSRLFGPDHPQTRETGHLLDGLGNG